MENNGEFSEYREQFSAEPAHYVLLKRVWDVFLTCRHAFRAEVRKDDSSEFGNLVLNRAEARMQLADLLVEELCDQCLENDWPIPTQIELDPYFSKEEGL